MVPSLDRPLRWVAVSEQTDPSPWIEPGDLVLTTGMALTGAVDVLWLTDKKGRDIAVPAAKIAYVEIGTGDDGKRIGFGG